MCDYRKQFDLSGKVAVVTGAAGILGRHFVAGLAAHGAAVAMLDLDDEALAEAANNVEGRILAVSCDITDAAQLQSAVDRVERELGPIDVLHNNAATKSSDVA